LLDLLRDYLLALLALFILFQTVVILQT